MRFSCNRPHRLQSSKKLEAIKAIGSDVGVIMGSLRSSSKSKARGQGLGPTTIILAPDFTKWRPSGHPGQTFFHIFPTVEPNTLTFRSIRKFVLYTLVFLDFFHGQVVL